MMPSTISFLAFTSPMTGAAPASDSLEVILLVATPGPPPLSQGERVGQHQRNAGQ